MLEMPVYQMTAKIADMYLSGGPMLDPDPSYAGKQHKYLQCSIDIYESVCYYIYLYV